MTKREIRSVKLHVPTSEINDDYELSRRAKRTQKWNGIKWIIKCTIKDIHFVRLLMLIIGVLILEFVFCLATSYGILLGAHVFSPDITLSSDNIGILANALFVVTNFVLSVVSVFIPERRN